MEDEEFELMVDSDEFDEFPEEAMQMPVKAPVVPTLPPTKKLKHAVGLEDINIGPSSLAFLADSKRKEDARAEEDEAEDAGRHQHLETLASDKCDLDDKREKPLLSDEQKKVVKDALLKAVFRPDEPFSRVFSGAKVIRGPQHHYDWNSSEEENRAESFSLKRKNVSDSDDFKPTAAAPASTTVSRSSRPTSSGPIRLLGQQWSADVF